MPDTTSGWQKYDDLAGDVYISLPVEWRQVEPSPKDELAGRKLLFLAENIGGRNATEAKVSIYQIETGRAQDTNSVIKWLQSVDTPDESGYKMITMGYWMLPAGEVITRDGKWLKSPAEYSKEYFFANGRSIYKVSFRAPYAEKAACESEFAEIMQTFGFSG